MKFGKIQIRYTSAWLKLPSLQTVVAVFLFLSLYVLIGINDTFWAPFLPSELSNRAASKTTIGIIVSASDAAGFLSGVYFMFFFKNIERRKFLFCFGDFIIGFACFLFCHLDKVATGTVYFLLCIATRSAKGCGITLMWCTGAPLLIQMFPKRTGSVCSWISAAISIGIVLGAPIGSFLYSTGGFKLPFSVIGVLQVLTSVLVYIAIPGGQEASREEKEFIATCKNALKFLSYEGVLLISLGATFAASSLGFLSVTFSSHLAAQYDIGSAQAGIYYLPFTLTRAVNAPVIGHIVDKGYARFIFAYMGCLLTAASFFLVYISQYFSGFFGSLVFLEIQLSIIGFRDFFSICEPPLPGSELCGCIILAHHNRTCLNITYT